MSNDLHTLLKKIPIFDEKTGGDLKKSYNIFEVMGVEYNEVIVCRFIGDLLDPKGSHGLGSEPLRLFIDTVLGDGCSNENLENAIVVLEEHTDNDRRIDIVIHLQDKVYPIEVKIWAGDQNKQLEDYYNNFFLKNGTGKIYYLTPDGHAPSEKSWGEPSDKVHCISFSKDIYNWLSEIQGTASEPIEFVIKNFKEVIRKMCKQHDELNGILNVLKLDNGECDSNEIKSVISLLKYCDEIWDKIRKKYIRGIISPGGYKIDECDRKDNKDTTTGISHILMKVTKNDETKAWICVEWYVYIVAKKEENDKCTKGWKEYNTNYQWKYIDEIKHIKLNYPTEELLDTDIKVNLEELLRGID